jgi:hypothetical protein
LMHTWYAVYLERAADDKPDALFANEQDAFQWGFDNALEYVDMQPMALDTPVPTVTEREIVWPSPVPTHST